MVDPGILEQSVPRPFPALRTLIAPLLTCLHLVTTLSAAQKVAQPIQDAVAAIRARRLSATEAGPLSSLSTDLVRINDAGEIQVYVILTEPRPMYVTQLEAVGLRVELTLPNLHLVQGWVPASAVSVIAAFDFVTEVKPPGYPVRHDG
jgi:hypothetical protein